MSNSLEDTDLLIYQSAETGSNGTVAAEDLGELNEDDLFVVYRPSNGLNYSVRAEDVGMGTKEPPVINSVTLTQDAVNDKRFTSNSFTTTVLAANQPESLGLRAEVTGALAIEAGTDLIVGNAYPGSSSNAFPVNLESDGVG